MRASSAIFLLSISLQLFCLRGELAIDFLEAVVDLFAMFVERLVEVLFSELGHVADGWIISSPQHLGWIGQVWISSPGTAESSAVPCSDTTYSASRSQVDKHIEY